MSKRANRKSMPRPGRSLVDAVWKRIGLTDEARAWRAMAAWAEVAGPRLAAHARAEAVRGTSIVIRVASSSWANELSYLRGELKAKLRQTPGAEWIDDLRFSIGPLDGAPAFTDEPRDPVPAPAIPEPPVVDGGKVAEALLRVEDPELRAALAELFARSRARG